MSQIDIVNALRRELRDLESDLEGDPRYRKIARIRALLTEYSPPTPNAVTPIARTRATSPNSKKNRVHDAIMNYLAAHPGAHRSELLSNLTSQGLLVGQKDPMASLAAYLSDFRSELQNNGQGHWSLKESAPDAEAPEPIEIPPPGGSDRRCLDAGGRSIRDGFPSLRGLVAHPHLPHALVTERGLGAPQLPGPFQKGTERRRYASPYRERRRASFLCLTCRVMFNHKN